LGSSLCIWRWGETVADYESLDDHQLIQWISQVDKEALETL